MKTRKEDIAKRVRDIKIKGHAFCTIFVLSFLFIVLYGCVNVKIKIQDSDEVKQTEKVKQEDDVKS